MLYRLYGDAETEFDSKIVAERLKNVFAARGLSYRDVASITGITVPCIQRYANGKVDKMQPDKINRIALKTYSSISYILGVSDVMDEEPSYELKSTYNKSLRKKEIKINNIAKKLSDENLDKLLDYAELLDTSQR